MEMLLTRDICGETCTEGILTVDGEFAAFTLEDVVRGAGEKIPGDTAIPEGRYKVIVNNSPRFQKELPLLLNVPNFDGIRIHYGNTAKDTEGCILVGRKRVPGAIQESRLTFDSLMHQITAAIRNGEEVWITIT